MSTPKGFPPPPPGFRPPPPASPAIAADRYLEEFDAAARRVGRVFGEGLAGQIRNTEYLKSRDRLIIGDVDMLALMRRAAELVELDLLAREEPPDPRDDPDPTYVDQPCPECGELGACATDAEGRALIHVTSDDDT